MKRIFWICSIFILSSCGGKDDPSPAPKPEKGVVLHTVMEMNRSEVVPGSHIGCELQSVLQPMPNFSHTIGPEKLTVGSDLPDNQKHPSYPRIKRLQNGLFMMVYHGGLESGQWSRIWYVMGEDYEHWTTPRVLFEPYYATVAGERPAVRFANPEILQLANGDILVVCAQRCVGFRDVEGLNGVVMRRSSDGGKTWSEPKMIWNQQNWEPYLLELPDGRIQCFFTDSDHNTQNSGTAMVESFDGGKTWSGRKRVSRQYKYDYRTTDPDHVKYNGTRIYTDQMPVFKLLPDGKTLCGWLECRLEDPVPADCNDSESYKSYVDMSLVFNDGFDWTALEGDAVGPERRKTNLFHNAGGGYVAVFPSGEVVLSCTSGKYQHLRMADATAQSYFGAKGWTKADAKSFTFPFPKTVKCRWPMAETAGSNLLMTACCSDAEGVHLAMLYLNQRQKAARIDVKEDGNPAEWTTDKGWFLGSESGVELFVRCALSGSRLCFALDCLDENLSAGATIILCKEDGSSPVNIKIGPEGLISSSASGASASASEAESASGAKGWVAEAGIQISSLGVSEGTTLRCYVMLEEGSTRTPFAFADGSTPSSWQTLSL